MNWLSRLPVRGFVMVAMKWWGSNWGSTTKKVPACCNMCITTTHRSSMEEIKDEDVARPRYFLLPGPIRNYHNDARTQRVQCESKWSSPRINSVLLSPLRLPPSHPVSLQASAAARVSTWCRVDCSGNCNQQQLVLQWWRRVKGGSRRFRVINCRQMHWNLKHRLDICFIFSSGSMRFARSNY